MCTGRVDPRYVFRAFTNGMDGVFIGGCRLNECNYVTQGNYHALNMVLLCRKIMEHIGLNPSRLRIEFMSSGDGIKFAEAVNDFEKNIEVLGPLGSGEGLDKEELSPRLEQIYRLIPYIKMEKKEKLRVRHEQGSNYADFFTTDEIDSLFNDIVSYYIDPEKCQACMICLRKCYVDAIQGGKDLIHIINQERCIRCGNCFDACPEKFSAVQELSGVSVPTSIPEGERKVVRKNKKAESKSISAE